MAEVTYREANTATVSESRRSAARRDTNAHGEGGYFDGYMEGY